MNSKEFIDEELSEKLLERALSGDQESESTLLWLAQFNNEYHKDWFKKDVEPLHRTKVLKKDCGRRNYLRRNDMFVNASRVDVQTDVVDLNQDLEHF